MVIDFQRPHSHYRIRERHKDLLAQAQRKAREGVGLSSGEALALLYELEDLQEALALAATRLAEWGRQIAAAGEQCRKLAEND
jgi:hypothetical protein